MRRHEHGGGLRPVAGARLLTAALAVLAMVTSAGAQMPPVPGGSAPAVPDTGRLAFAAADSLPAPTAFHVLGDTVAFGGLLGIAWDLPPGAASAGAPPTVAGDQLILEPEPARPWWRITGGGRSKLFADAVAALPPSPGERVVATYRVYRTAPFRLEWLGRTSPVVLVRGRVDDPSRLAAIRDPRPVGWFTAAAAVLLALLVLLAAASWWWWRRRRRRDNSALDWSLPEPAWIGTALALRVLLAERHLERGDTRLFLDGLAAVARRHAAGHFGVAAAEMTGRELVASCNARGYAPVQPEALARIIDAADLHRYDRAAPTAEWCRQEAVDLLTALSATRVMPRQTPVAAERLLEAGKAWTAVTADLAGAAIPGEVAR
ncbi:MAG: hypothetical protein IPJ24_08125 [bacterium]|nr:hypothetical protein [bacterium]